MRTAVRLFVVAIPLFWMPGRAFAELPSPRCLQTLQTITVPQSTTGPELMAIGDSVYNGVTSLTIDRWRTQHSIPALVAKALSISSFQLPQYPRPILLDVEREVSHTLLGILDTAGNGIDDNIRWWLQTYPSVASAMPEYFDDIAVAQATSKQLICDTAAQAQFWLTKNPIDVGSLDFPDAIGSWYYELNSRFVLDPRLDTLSVGAVSRDHLSQLGQVMVREPKRLLINIGSNDGVWLMAFSGYLPQTSYQNCAWTSSSGQNHHCEQTTVAHEMTDLISNMATIAHYIPAATKFVYVNNLPPPSRAANLSPLPDATTMHCNNSADQSGPPSVYFSMYKTYLSDEKLAEVTGDQACKMDRQVNVTNAAIAKAMRDILGSRLVIVDLNALLMKYDGKHLGAGHGIPVTLEIAGEAHVELDNRVVRPVTIFGNLNSGGLFGYDNMHPSFVGYSLAARQVLDTIISNEPNLPPYDESVLDYQSIVREVEKTPEPSAIKTNAISDTNIWVANVVLDLLPATPSEAAPSKPRTWALPRLLSLTGRQTTAE